MATGETLWLFFMSLFVFVSYIYLEFIVSFDFRNCFRQSRLIFMTMILIGIVVFVFNTAGLKRWVFVVNNMPVVLCVFGLKGNAKTASAYYIEIISVNVTNIFLSKQIHPPFTQNKLVA